MKRPWMASQRVMNRIVNRTAILMLALHSADTHKMEISPRLAEATMLECHWVNEFGYIYNLDFQCHFNLSYKFF